MSTRAHHSNNPSIWRYVISLILANILGTASSTSLSQLASHELLDPTPLELIQESLLKNLPPHSHQAHSFGHSQTKSRPDSFEVSQLPCYPDCPPLSLLEEAHLQRQLRSPGYLLRTRKSMEDVAIEDEADFSRPARSEKYLFRVRKDPSQIRNRKGGYLFRTRKDGQEANKRGEYLFRTRKSFDFGKRQAGYLFRTKKNPGALPFSSADGASADVFEPVAMKTRKDMYLFRT